MLRKRGGGGRGRAQKLSRVLVEGRYNALSFTSEECDPVWIVKHLRNNWLQHDTEHGSANTREQKREALKADLASLGHTIGMPRTPQQFESLQTNLLEKLCGMAQLVLDGRRGQMG